MNSNRNWAVVDAYIRAPSVVDDDTMRSLVQPDAIFDWPQTRERIKGVAAMREIDRSHPGGLPNARARRVLGDGLIARTTEYWAPRSPAPAWRAEWVTAMPEDV